MVLTQWSVCASGKGWQYLAVARASDPWTNNTLKEET